MGDTSAFSDSTERVKREVGLHFAQWHRRKWALRIYLTLGFGAGFILAALTWHALAWSNPEQAAFWVLSFVAGLASTYVLYKEYVCDEWYKAYETLAQSTLETVARIPWGRSAFLSLSQERGASPELQPLCERILALSFSNGSPSEHTH